MSENRERQLTISQIYAKGQERLKEAGSDWIYPGGKKGPCVQANRRYLDSLFFEPKFFDPVDVDTSCTLFGIKLKTPVFCSAMSRLSHWTESDIADIAKGVAAAGSFFILGIGGSTDLQSAIETGAPVVKMVKPYKNIDLIYENVRDAEKRGCAAVGMDIDHFYGAIMDERVILTHTFSPQCTDEIGQLIAQTKLPFIVKGVLSFSDAEKAIQLGAAAIIVSNHGSGAFDFTVPSMIALPKIADNFGDKLTVLVDTGFETGNDVFKALAFGAKGVGFANPIVLALAADGSKGVELLINQITAQLHRNMAATGCTDLSAIRRTIFKQVLALDVEP